MSSRDFLIRFLNLKKSEQRSGTTRILILSVLFLLFWSGLIVRAAWIQLIPNQRLESLKRRQFETTITVGNRRGAILDRNGNELATSAPAWSLFADPKLIQNPRVVSMSLVKVLLKKQQVQEQRRIAGIYYNRIKHKERRFVWLRRQLSSEVKVEIEKLKIKGIGFIEEPKRIYPNDRLLANVIGFVGKDGSGLEGLELKYNDVLSGAKKKVALQKDARGRPLVINGRLFTEVPDGSTIELTIDRELQFVVERELSEAVNYHEALAGTAVVLDAQTSEILALATVPTFNANLGTKVLASRQGVRRNRVVTDVFEPGSTMKAFVMATAIEEGKIQPNTKIFGEWGQMRLGDRIIREADSKHKFGMITVTDALAHSSNIVAAKVAGLVGAEALRKSYQKFGFGSPLGVDVPGEARGILQPLPWGEHLLANVSFGHGVAVTALQMANAYAVLANGGLLNRPYIVKSIRDAETGEIVEEKPMTIRRAVSPETASKMRLMLSATTGDQGTGFNARVSGFPVAGKTGTAQRVRENGRGYEPGAYVASFAGFLPVNDPKYVILVVLDKPQKNYYGSAVAAPVFANIAQYAVTRGGLAPVLFSGKNVIPKNAAEKARNPEADANAWRAQHGLMTEVERRHENRRLLQAQKAMRVPAIITASRGIWDALDVFSEKRQEDLVQQITAESSLDKNSNVVQGADRQQESLPDLATDEETLSPNSVRIPDVIGLSLREAMQAMGQAGIPWTSIKAVGSGFVSRQSPPPGTVTQLRRARLELKIFE